MNKRFYSKLNYLPDDEYPMTSVLRAINNAIPYMVPGKRYELREIIELGAPGLWDRFKQLEKKCIGYTVAGLVSKGEITDIYYYDPNKRPLKYLVVT